MSLQSIGSRLSDAKPVIGQSATFVLSLTMFALALTAVVYGFIGYYSRVALASEFQQKNTSIDYVFLQVRQLEQDEQDLKSLREKLAELLRNTRGTLITTKATAYTSMEYKEYLDAASAVTEILYNATHILAEDYLVKVNKIDYGQPDIEQAQLFATPEYRAGTSTDQQIQLYQKLTPAIRDFRSKIVNFNGQHGNQINQMKIWREWVAGISAWPFAKF
jgi:hypothetical protein